MRLFFKGVRIDERTRKYIQKRLESFEKIIDKPYKVAVEIDLNKRGKFRVETMIKTPYNLFRAEEVTESIEGSIDLVSSQIKIQIKKDKEKRETLAKRGGRSIKKRVALDKSARF